MYFKTYKNNYKLYCDCNKGIINRYIIPNFEDDIYEYNNKYMNIIEYNIIYHYMCNSCFKKYDINEINKYSKQFTEELDKEGKDITI